MAKLKVKYYMDPGHGWFAVKLDLIRKLGLLGKISVFSYVKGGTAYLEEDSDAPAFLEAAKAAGIEVEVVPFYRKKTAIRSYSHFSF